MEQAALILKKSIKKATMDLTLVTAVEEDFGAKLSISQLKVITVIKAIDIV